LWCQQWSEGIAEGIFTKYEILQQFETKGINIPENLLIEFNNRVSEKKYKYMEKMIEEFKRNKK